MTHLQSQQWASDGSRPVIAYPITPVAQWGKTESQYNKIQLEWVRCMKTSQRISAIKAERSLRLSLKLCRLELLLLSCWNLSLSIKSVHEREQIWDRQSRTWHELQASFVQSQHYPTEHKLPFYWPIVHHCFWHPFNTLIQRTTSEQQGLLQDGWQCLQGTIHHFSYHYINGQGWILSLWSKIRA